MPSFIACAMTDCRWNRDGQCNKSEIFVDQGVMCSNYEPEVADLGLGLGAPGPDPRAMLLQQLAGGMAGGMAGGGAPPAVGGGPVLPGGEAPPPLRF